MIVTRGLGRAVVVGALVAFGLGVDAGAAAATTFSGGNARIGGEVVDRDARVGSLLAVAEPARAGGEVLADDAERIGAAALELAARVGAEQLVEDVVRVGLATLGRSTRIGGARLKGR